MFSICKSSSQILGAVKVDVQVKTSGTPKASLWLNETKDVA